MGATRGAITLALLATGVLAGQRPHSPPSPWISRTEWSYAYESNSASREHPLTLQVQNPHGGISIIVRPSTELEIRSSSPDRESTAEDVAIARVENVYQVVVRPPDGAPIDLQIFIPYRAFVEAATIAGPIDYTGFGKAALQTDSGAVTLTAPKR